MHPNFLEVYKTNSFRSCFVGNFVCWLYGLERQVHNNVVINMQFEEEK